MSFHFEFDSPTPLMELSEDLNINSPEPVGWAPALSDKKHISELCDERNRTNNDLSAFAPKCGPAIAWGFGGKLAITNVKSTSVSLVL